jgi:hypothetical protein
MVLYEPYSVFFPEPILIGFSVFKSHVSHIHIHEGCSRKEMRGLRRNNSNGCIRIFSNMPGGCDTSNSISYNNYLFHIFLSLHCILRVQLALQRELFL